MTMPRYTWDSEAGCMVKTSDKVPNRGSYVFQEKTLRESVLEGYKQAAQRGPLRCGWKPETIKRAWRA